jgi:D-glycero-D-manno-heptose 1,7-bisphosphate phosphatase
MREKRKAIFLDKDGTLVKDVPYNVDVSKIVYEDGVAESLKGFSENDYLLVVVSNQSGVARGMFTIDAINNVRRKIESDFRALGITLEAFYFCPHHPCGIVDNYAIDCNCRKPKPGLILQAASDLNVDLSESWMIGDILDDVEAGNRAGCNTILINNGNETEWMPGEFRVPTFSVTNMLEAAGIILSQLITIKHED